MTLEGEVGRCSNRRRLAHPGCLQQPYVATRRSAPRSDRSTGLNCGIAGCRQGGVCSRQQTGSLLNVLPTGQLDRTGRGVLVVQNSPIA